MTIADNLNIGSNQSDDCFLSVENLQVDVKTSRGQFRVVDGVSWAAKKGETLAIVGESGSGKSVTALSVMGLLPKPAASIGGGRILFQGKNILDLSEGSLRHMRGRDMAMIFQDPMTSLNPVLTIGEQITEPLLKHLKMTTEQARSRAQDLLAMVGIHDAERRLNQYPHQFSGGMRQRVMIAIALACHPNLIIADEPTTALDVTIQAQILEMMSDLTRRLGITLVIITHNLGIVARYADRVAVMYAGKIVEQGLAPEIFKNPQHPYTRGLLRSVPRLDRPRGLHLETIEGYPPSPYEQKAGCYFASRCDHAQSLCYSEMPAMKSVGANKVSCHFSGTLHPDHKTVIDQKQEIFKAPSEILLDVKNIHKFFGHTSIINFGVKHTLHAVKDVSFSIGRGETLGLVGESGCGKTTVGRMILQLEKASSGDILFDGESLASASSFRMRELRRDIQVIFQDPYASLNPRMTMAETLVEPLIKRLGKSIQTAQARVDELLDQVGLLRDLKDRYPHQLSGGQRQRIGIARALAFEPKLIVCDEPVSALDVSIQGQIINLLSNLQKILGISYLFIAHDLAVVRHISHRVIVMYRGKIVEMAECNQLYDKPQHPYTKALLESAPIPDPSIEKNRQGYVLQGEISSVFSANSGCLFANRCPQVINECHKLNPDLTEVYKDHYVACLHHAEQSSSRISGS